MDPYALFPWFMDNEVNQFVPPPGSALTSTPQHSVASAPPSATLSSFISTYTTIDPKEFNRYLSFLDEMNVNTTCKALYTPFLMVRMQLDPSWLDSINPFTPKPFTRDTLMQHVSNPRFERYLNIFTAKNSQLLEKYQFNFGPYTQQLLIAGDLTLAQAEKLSHFIDLYKEQKFNSNKESLQWLQTHIKKDDVLHSYLSPGYLYWSKCISGIKQSSSFDDIQLNLEFILLIYSKGIQKYIAPEELESFLDKLITVSNQRTNRSGVFIALLNTFNNNVFQAYIDEHKAAIDEEDLNTYFGSDGYKNRKDTFKVLTDPIVKKYVDEGIVRNVEELINMPIAGLHMLCSPIVRAGYEQREYDLPGLKTLITQFRDQAYGAEHYVLSLFSNGHWKYNRIANLTDFQRSLLLDCWHTRNVKNLTEEEVSDWALYRTKK